MIFFKQLIKIFSRFIVLYGMNGIEGGSSKVEDEQTQELNEFKQSFNFENIT